MARYEVFAGNNPNALFSGDTGDAVSGLQWQSPPGTVLASLDGTGFFMPHAFAAGSVGTLQTLDTGGTITADGVLVTPLTQSSAANKSGIILFQPTTNLFKLFVNRGANSFTFAAAGTSFVANGTGAIIPALCAMWMFYDVSSSLWYVTNL